MLPIEQAGIEQPRGRDVSVELVQGIAEFGTVGSGRGRTSSELEKEEDLGVVWQAVIWADCSLHNTHLLPMNSSCWPATWGLNLVSIDDYFCDNRLDCLLLAQ